MSRAIQSSQDDQPCQDILDNFPHIIQKKENIKLCIIITIAPTSRARKRGVKMGKVKAKNGRI